jgi:hypothetical protein
MEQARICLPAAAGNGAARRCGLNAALLVRVRIADRGVGTDATKAAHRAAGARSAGTAIAVTIPYQLLDKHESRTLGSHHTFRYWLCLSMLSIMK